MTEDGVLTLDIEETQLSDKSRITIRAENSFGIAGEQKGITKLSTVYARIMR